MAILLQEVAFSDLTDLVAEAIDAHAFVGLKGDDQPFLLSIPELFNGHPDCHFFALVESPSQMVGFAVLLPHKRQGVLSIGPVYISEARRGRGLGKLLVEELIQWATARGITGLYTQTWGGNIPSRRVFEASGFRCVGETPDTRVNGDSTVQYALLIGEG